MADISTYHAGPLFNRLVERYRPVWMRSALLDLDIPLRSLLGIAAGVGG